MDTITFDLKHNFTIGKSNGTTAEIFQLTQSDTYITIQDVSLFGKVILRDAPETHKPLGKNRPAQPAVVASLERSLKDNADVWAELSKY